MAFSPKVKQAVLTRSGGLCERQLPSGRRCLSLGHDYHHIVRKGMGGRHGEAKKISDSEANCMMVCLSCHGERHDGQGWNEDAADLVPGKEFRAMLLTPGKPYVNLMAGINKQGVGR